MENLSHFRSIHLVGIGGAGMSPIAAVLLDRGFAVSGSDLAENAMTRKLAAQGARIVIGHNASNVSGADLVVTSTAIGKANPEREAAEAAGIPIWRRARVLAEIMRAGRSIAVSGTHGKTTTTSMLGLMLTQAQMDPTVLIGGELASFGGNARAGRGEWIVAEADESDASLLEMDPDRIIVTNIEADHLDFYANLEAIERTFGEFVGRLRPGGKFVACLDDPIIARLAERCACPVIGYGLSHPGAGARADWVEVTHNGCGSRFAFIYQGQPIGEVDLVVPGRHNVLNAMGALACALDLGAPFEPLCEALAAYQGAKRRFQVKGTCAGITIVDDYAHHPTEISATLAAARGRLAAGGGRLVCLFQPHRYTRTLYLAEAFGRALLECDVVVVADVYSAGELPITGVSGQLIHDALTARGHRNAHFAPTLAEARAWLADNLEPGDLFLTLGAGDVWKVGEGLLEDLESREAAQAS